ncbi:unnamed protein product [Citrullus colocynthis]|uniref:Uncharacterized protein n=1 Tax=Citrullus colocynthis TaxID=252529 RepID=A0ABP0Y1C0_9ROSI
MSNKFHHLVNGKQANEILQANEMAFVFVPTRFPLIGSYQLQERQSSQIDSPLLTPININSFLPLPISWFQHLLLSKLFPFTLFLLRFVETSKFRFAIC